MVIGRITLSFESPVSWVTPSIQYISFLGERLQGEKSKDGENLVRGVSAAMQQANDDEEDDWTSSS